MIPDAQAIFIRAVSIMVLVDMVDAPDRSKVRLITLDSIRLPSISRLPEFISSRDRKERRRSLLFIKHSIDSLSRNCLLSRGRLRSGVRIPNHTARYGLFFDQFLSSSVLACSSFPSLSSLLARKTGSSNARSTFCVFLFSLSLSLNYIITFYYLIIYSCP